MGATVLGCVSAGAAPPVVVAVDGAAVVPAAESAEVSIAGAGVNDGATAAGSLDCLGSFDSLEAGLDLVLLDLGVVVVVVGFGDAGLGDSPAGAGCGASSHMESIEDEPSSAARAGKPAPRAIRQPTTSETERARMSHLA